MKILRNVYDGDLIVGRKPPGLNVLWDRSADYRRRPIVALMRIPQGTHPDLNGMPAPHPRYTAVLFEGWHTCFEIYYYKDLPESGE